MSEKNRTPPAAAAAGLIALAVLAGCATPGAGPSQERTPIPSPSGSTAVAGDAGASGPAKTLTPGPLDAPVETSVEEARRSAEMAAAMAGGHEGHGGHGGHGAHGVAVTPYRHVDVGRAQAAQAPAAEPHHHHHGAGEEETAAVYTCPMHPEVTSGEPGTCPKCGMALVERRKE